MKQLARKFFRSLDPLIALCIAPAALIMRLVRADGLQNMRLTQRVLRRIGVLPIRDHYYEPQITYLKDTLDYGERRDIPGIELSIPGQLEFLQKLKSADLFSHFATDNDLGFNIDNKSFGHGDADFWFQVVRHFKPRRIIEVGSGNSTLVALGAAKENTKDDPHFHCRITCIEPYEQPWLESLPLEVIRKPVETLDPDFFCQLTPGDVLFVDSSHVIRPAGDVLFLLLRVLPRLQVGVLVHFHDIFSPFHYPREWLEVEQRLWNEQYVLEAYLTENPHWRILASLNFLHAHHRGALAHACPFLGSNTYPKSLYLERVA